MRDVIDKNFRLVFEMQNVSQLRGGVWSYVAIALLFGIIFFMAGTIVIALIPLYIKSSTQPEGMTLLSFEFNKTLLFDRNDLPATKLTMNASALAELQSQFQKGFDTDSDASGSSVSLDEAHSEPTETKKKREIFQSQQRAVSFSRRLYVKGKFRIPRHRVRQFNYTVIALRIIERIIKEVWIRLYAPSTLTTMTTTIRPSITTGGQASVSVSAITSSVGSGGPSVSANPTTPSSGKRRRRDLSPSASMSATHNHMPIAGTFVISLTYPNQIIDHLRQHHSFFKYLPHGIQHIPGVDGERIDLYKFLQQGKISKQTYDKLIQRDQPIGGHYLTLGSLGCLESHVSAWRRVVELDQPMLILEDDISFNKDLFDTMMPYLLYSLPTDFSLLYFGNLIGKDFQTNLRDYNDLLWKVTASNWGTYAYLISPQAAAVLLDFIYPANAQVDSMIRNIAETQSFNVYMSKQLLVHTNNQYGRVSKTQRFNNEPIMIPRVFHFIWLNGEEPPESAKQNMAQWRELHPGWDLRLWTNQTIHQTNNGLSIYNRDLLTETTRSLRQRSDIVRYEVVYQLGGVYVDMDFEPLKNIESLLHGIEAFVVHENEIYVCNGIFGMIPGHKLGEKLVLELESSKETYANETVNQQTGPFHMTRQVDALEGERITKFAPHVFFPYAWYEQDPGHPYAASAYAVHHFRSVEEIYRDAKERL